MKTLISIFLLAGIMFQAAADSVQLLSNPGMDNSRAWKTFGKNGAKEQQDGKTTLVLQIQESEKNVRSAWRGDTILPKKELYGPFTVTFEAEIKDIVPERSDNVWAGFVVLIHGHKEGKYANVKVERINASGDDFRQYSVKGVLPADLEDLYLEFVLQHASGKVKIRNASMMLAPITDKQSTIKTKVVGGREVELLQVSRHPVSSAPLRSAEKDFVFFDGSNTRQIYNTTIPDAAGLITRAATFGTPGELRKIFIGVHALRDLLLKTVRFSDLKTPEGKTLPASAIKTFLVHNWPQGDGMGRSLTYSVVPEVLLPFQGTEFKKNSSVNLMFQFDIPKDTAPGIYSGNISFTTGEQEKNLPLTLRVLPFSLIRPDNDRMCYLAHVGDFGDTAEDAVSACLEFKQRGINGLVMACQYGKGMLRVKKDGDTPHIESFKKMDQALAGYKAAQMTGPLILHMGDHLEIAVARAMGFELPPGNEKGGVTPAMRTPEFSAAMQTILAELKEKCAGTDLYIMCIDEPGAYVDRRERALWQCQEIRKAGLKAAVYQYGDFWKQLKDICQLQIFARKSVPGQSRDELAQQVRNARVKPYSYGIHGSYEGSPCGIMPGRARSGFMAHEEEFVGQTLWLYAPGTPIRFDGVEQLKFFPRLKYRGMNGELYSTLQWEGICDGINDYAYMNTLDVMLSRHKEDKTAREIAVSYRELRKNLKKQINPNESDEDKIALFANRTADAVRYQIAEWIVELQNTERK